MRILTKEEFLNRAGKDDVYLVGIESDNDKFHFHILAYSETLDEKLGVNEPTFLFIPQDTAHNDLWKAISERLNDVKLYGGAFEDGTDVATEYEAHFLTDDSIIVMAENAEQAMSLLKFAAETMKTKTAPCEKNMMLTIVI